MKIHRWARYFKGDAPTFTGTTSYMAIGVRGSGKSALLEHIGLKYIEKGRGILDVYGSRDGESLCWLKAPEVSDMNLRVLLLHGSNTSISSCYDNKPVTNFKLSDLNHYDLIISSGPLYSSIEQEFSELNTVIDACFNRRKYKRIFYLIVREAANLVYSRLKVSDNQTTVKGILLLFVREMRHSGFSLGIDTQKVTSIDLDVRTSLDYILVKSLGYLGLPDELSWLYSMYVPRRLQNMAPQYFILVSRTGGTGVGSFPLHEWHHKPGEDILEEVGIEVEHGEELLPTKKSSQVGDLDHIKIVNLRLDGLSFRDIANEMKISTSTALNHVTRHNQAVKGSGVCPNCSRAKSPHASHIAEKPEN